MVKEKLFGILDGDKIPVITISAGESSGESTGESSAGSTGEGSSVSPGGNGRIEVDLIPFGAAVRAIRVPDKDKVMTDVCLGYDLVSSYRDLGASLGGSIGRFANRIGGARFTIDGTEYRVTPNEGANCLHGGALGFHKRIWDYETGDSSVTFRLFSPDGDEGFPGNFTEEVTYTVDRGALIIDYHARVDKACPVSLTNHAYFNLAGQGGGPVTDHVVALNADHYTPVDEGKIPTGEIRAVDGSVFDLRSPVVLGDRIAVPGLAEGFDHNFVLNAKSDRCGTVSGTPDSPETAGSRSAGAGLPACAAPDARVYCPRTGIFMEMYTSLPAVQFYTAGMLSERTGKDGVKYGPYHGFCLESQQFPDAMNHPEFPNAVIEAGGEFAETTIYRFGVVR